MPGIVVALMMLTLLEQGAFLSRLLAPFGIALRRMVRAPAGIGTIVGMAWKEAPLMGVIVGGALAAVPEHTVQAARSLGAGVLATAWHIGLPVAQRGLLGGSLVVFASSLEEFDKTFIVGAPNVQTLPVLLYFQLDGAGIIFPAAAVASFILLLPGLIIFLLAAKVLRDEVAAEGVMSANEPVDALRNG